MSRPRERNKSDETIVEAADTAVEDEVLVVAMDVVDAEVVADAAGATMPMAICPTRIGM